MSSVDKFFIFVCSLGAAAVAAGLALEYAERIRQQARESALASVKGNHMPTETSLAALERANPLRPDYRELTDTEKAQVAAIKAKGAEFIDMLDGLASTPQPIDDGSGMAMGRIDVDLGIAREKIIEATMWAVRHVTA